MVRRGNPLHRHRPGRRGAGTRSFRAAGTGRINLRVAASPTTAPGAITSKGENTIMQHDTKIKVRGYHLDLYGHVNNARYLEFLEEARWNYFESRGDLPWFLQSGLALVVVNINIDYRYPATMGDELVIETGVKSIGTRSAVMHQRVSLAGGGKLVAEADVTFAVFDAKQGKAVALDGKLKELLEQMLAEQA
nr:thioesterase family protein [Chromobacterium alkanivorans]